MIEKTTIENKLVETFKKTTIEESLLRIPDEVQKNTVHDLLQGNDANGKKVAQQAWRDVIKQEGGRAMLSPLFENSVYANIVASIAKGMLRTSSRAMAIALALLIADMNPAVHIPYFEKTALAGTMEDLEKAEAPFGPDKAYSSLLNAEEYLDDVYPTDNPSLTLSSYEEFSNGDPVTTFKKAIKKLRLRIKKIAQGDSTRESALITRVSNQAVNAPAFQTPYSVVEQWLLAEELSDDQLQYNPNTTSLDNLKQAVAKGNETEIVQTLADLEILNGYNQAIEYLYELVNSAILSPEVKKKIALKVAAHRLINGSNSALFFYHRIEDTEIGQDPDVKAAFELVSEEVTAKRDTFRYETDTSLRLPHLRTAGALGDEAELVIHPFYSLTKIRDYQGHGTVYPTEDFTDSVAAVEATQQTIQKMIERGIRGNLTDLLLGMDLLEQYNQLTNTDPNRTYIIILPKFEPSHDDVSTSAESRYAEKNALLSNAWYVEGSSMYYAESQTDGAGYLYPADLEILLSVNPNTHYTVSGESPKRCVSNAISDIPSHRITAHPEALSLDEREINNFLLQDPKFKQQAELLRAKIQEVYNSNNPATFEDLSALISDNPDILDFYRTTVAKMFLPTMDRN